MQYTNGRLFDGSYSHAYSPRMSTIATRLDEAMKEAREYGPNGISQSELQRKSGVPQATISRTLKGTTDPEVDTIRRLAAALSVTFEWLNEGIQPKYRDEKKAGEPDPGVKLASSREDAPVSPEKYAELIQLFGHAPQFAQKEALRILGAAVKSASKRRHGGA